MGLKLFMRKNIFILFFIPFIGNGQLKDTASIQARWIAMSPTEQNAQLFGKDKNSRHGEDIVTVVKKNLEEGKIHPEKVFSYNCGQNGLRESSAVKWNKAAEQDEISSNIKKNPFLDVIQVPPTIPLSTMYGEDSIVIDDSGNVLIVYPPTELFTLPSDIRKANKILIKEERILNEKTKKYEFQPVMIGFYFNGTKFYNGHTTSWIELSGLFESLEDKEKYDWYQFLVSRKYSGFQYMQTSYNDHDIYRPSLD